MTIVAAVAVVRIAVVAVVEEAGLRVCTPLPQEMPVAVAVVAKRISVAVAVEARLSQDNNGQGEKDDLKHK